jgi:hypothetical protein
MRVCLPVEDSRNEVPLQKASIAVPFNALAIVLILISFNFVMNIKTKVDLPVKQQKERSHPEQPSE